MSPLRGADHRQKASEVFAKPNVPPAERALGVLPRRINEIVLAKRAITLDTALRLARYFGT